MNIKTALIAVAVSSCMLTPTTGQGNVNILLYSTRAGKKNW